MVIRLLQNSESSQAEIRDRVNEVIAAANGGGDSGATTKRAMLAFGGSGNGANDPTALVELNTRLPVLLPVTTTRWRLRIANVSGTPNAYDVATAYLPGVVSFNGVYVGPAVIGVDGEPTGATTSMTSALGAFGTNADGTDYLTPWVTDPATQFTAQQMSLISYGWTTSGMTSMGTSNAKYWYRFGAGRLAGVSQTNPGAFGSGNGSWLDVRLEYEFYGAQAVGLAVGDSLTEAQFSPSGGAIYQTWHQQASLAGNSPIVTTARGGQGTVAFSNTNAWEWTRLGTELTLDYAILYLGTNDASVAGTPSDTAANRLANFQVRYGTVIGLLKTKYNIDKKVVFTPPPGNFEATIKEPTRVLMVSWLKTAPYGASAVIDADRLLRDPADFTQLAADYKGSDSIHHSRAAHTAEGVVVAAAVPNVKRV